MGDEQTSRSMVNSPVRAPCPEPSLSRTLSKASPIMCSRPKRLGIRAQPGSTTELRDWLVWPTLCHSVSSCPSDPVMPYHCPFSREHLNPAGSGPESKLIHSQSIPSNCLGKKKKKSYNETNRPSELGNAWPCWGSGGDPGGPPVALAS